MSMDIAIVDTFKITKNRFEMGINGTIFNADYGYRIPNVRPPNDMMIYDEKMANAVQIFLSNYFIESFLSSFFQRQ